MTEDIRWIQRFSNFNKVLKKLSEVLKNIDLCLIGKDLSLNDVFQLEEEINSLMLAYTFDIIIHKTIDNSELLNHIERVGKSVYSKK